MTHARARLAQARLYVCTDARQSRSDLAAFVEQIVTAGVDIVQLRDKSLSSRDEIAALHVVADVCQRHGALWAVNDRVDVALAVGAPIVHLGQDDLPVVMARAMLGPDVLLGQSTHSREQAMRAAADPEVDYFAVGPLWQTPTKPGRPAVGLGLAEWVAHEMPTTDVAPKPWFAIGGIDSDNLAQVCSTGAHRVVVVRAVTQAPDPFQAVRDLRTRLADSALPVVTP